MKEYRVDLHIHSVLSPCGDLDMSPSRIIEEAVRKNLDIIGITDHNSTRQAKLVYELGQEKGLMVFCGAEVTSREEIHSMTFFENFDDLLKFQEYLDKHLIFIKNDPLILGYQLIVDREEMIIHEENRSLASALDVSIEELSEQVHHLNGLIIPCHVDRFVNSIYSQLGFFPEGLEVDAVEISWRTNPQDFVSRHPELKSYTIVSNSDAHYPNDIGRVCNVVSMNEKSFNEFKLALRNEGGRGVRQV
jgi:3',5'-nucleoside bisphosphate phosphatase